MLEEVGSKTRSTFAYLPVASSEMFQTTQAILLRIKGLLCREGAQREVMTTFKVVLLNLPREIVGNYENTRALNFLV